jgi:hypothetical protein
VVQAAVFKHEGQFVASVPEFADLVGQLVYPPCDRVVVDLVVLVIRYRDLTWPQLASTGRDCAASLRTSGSP